MDGLWEECPGKDWHTTCDDHTYEHAVATILSSAPLRSAQVREPEEAMSAGKCATCRKDLAGHDRELFEMNKYHPFAPSPAAGTVQHYKCHERCVTVPPAAAGSEPTPPVGPGSATPTESPRRWTLHPSAPHTYVFEGDVCGFFHHCALAKEEHIHVVPASALAEALAQQNTDLTDLHQKVHAEDAEKLAEMQAENARLCASEVGNATLTRVRVLEESLDAEKTMRDKFQTEALETQRQRDEYEKILAAGRLLTAVDNSRIADLQRRLDEAVDAAAVLEAEVDAAIPLYGFSGPEVTDRWRSVAHTKLRTILARERGESK